ncbi:urease accessory protein UreD [Rathayibacter sp. Leaf296]|uniref:urease accessory protein UreD n=1 Tax=Rathayibacter sp. Leaf296 TaxID=1736327 RepID=UPI0007030A44|nr:urease accessory protein UreD [Rathayibacter sp. Leaf296]KQQ08247.1 hypothetical protein ASF46_13020 [Rathayibacter sp. Leaf296]
MTITRIALRKTRGSVHVVAEQGLLSPRIVSRTATGAHVALVANGALLLGGDRVDIVVDVGPGCALELSDIGGTVTYDGRGATSTWNVDLAIGVGGRLRWHTLPFVVADGADVVRRCHARMEAGAGLSLRDTLVLGRSGERGGRMRTTTIIEDPAGPVLHETLAVDGRSPEPGVLGRHRVLDTVTLLGRPAPEWPEARPENATRTTLDTGGAVFRAFGASTHDADLADVWDTTASGELSAQERRSA